MFLVRGYYTTKTRDPTEAAGAISDRFRSNTTSLTTLFVVIVLSLSYSCAHSVELVSTLAGHP